MKKLAAALLAVGMAHVAHAQTGVLSGGNVTSTGSTTPRTLQDRFAEQINILDRGVSSSASDNTANLQAAINAAVAAKLPLRIPAASSCYKYTAPLTVSGNLTIIGDSLTQNWPGANQINIPSSSPPLLGSVLCPTSNGSDALDVSGTAIQLNMTNVGFLFQTPFSGTGDGVHYIPTGTNQGLSGSRWDNVIVYGHDGNHYAYNLQNILLDTIIDAAAYGGGLFNLYGNSTTLQYGNTVFVHPYGQVIVGGTADGFHIDASQAQALNWLNFIRPQAITNNAPGLSPSGNPPTSAQYIWYQGDNVQTVRAIQPDLETIVGSSVRFGSSAHQNAMDWEGMNGDFANIYANSWGVNGLLFGPQTRTVTDISSSGTLTEETLLAFPGYHQAASSATTYTNLDTLLVGGPICGTNCTATNLWAIKANGNVEATGDIVSLQGAFFSGGTVNLNQNSNFAVNVGTGSTTATVTIGGNSNTLNLNAATLQSRGTAAVSCAANSVSLTTFVVTNGVVTHC